MMILSHGNSQIRRLFQISLKLKISRGYSSLDSETEIERIVRVINDHPFPNKPLTPTLRSQLPPNVLSTPLVENIIGRLFAAHSNGLKAYELFKYCLCSDVYIPSSDAFEKTIHILTRMRYFEKAWELMERIKSAHSSLLTLKSMSIMLSRIAKTQSYEETVKAFKKMENNIFTEKKFGTDEFNVFLRAFCTQRKMQEARSVFNKMHSQFPPDIKTMNILLLGFKESGDVTSVELFYHEMIRRGFQPNHITYNIRIDAYCKKGHFGAALRLFEEMKRVNCTPSLETITTLIHGAGIARNITKAKELLEDIRMRNLQLDTGAYNAMLSCLVRSNDIVSAVELMEEMQMKNIKHDSITYHTMFLGLMKLKGIEDVANLYFGMSNKNFVPKTQTVVLLMKYFCGNGNIDLGLHLWNYMVKKGHCPHSHALDVLVMGLCARDKVEEAFVCSRQMLERGRPLSAVTFHLLKRLLREGGELDKLANLEAMIKKLTLLLPPSNENHIDNSIDTDEI